ncbi:vanin-like protein 1 [Tribolium castaneum]|uniref:Vanin-like protein 2 n=1 Tax=Tribolium castaneum TaxID=7070 RepID=D6WR06_TRICA|nr:PREDICTED: vanin-like protein 2 [Tribolium castaneum]EFA06536.1 Vanin-like protein 2 [Tribolium castaneum]|eukprot:XP_970529.1 PREDICTED: vanin-like protein 2 [Tribolium castaneum]
MILLLAFSLSIFAFSEASKWENVTIAVVEYKPILDSSLNEPEIVAKNAQKYIEIITNVAKDRNLDLIVFPEETLYVHRETAVTIKLDNPCDSDTYPQFLRNLSCAARSSHTYLALNLVDKVKCDQSQTNSSKNCKNSGFFYYNTDVVFDRNGTIVNRYHKYNLFGEREMDKPETAEEIVIETDFGLKLGIFTCFDILFKAPAQELLKDGIDGAIYPSMWYSELPFLTAMQTQEMWASRHNTTLLAAGANSPLVGSGGSGVYRGAQGLVVGGIVAEGGTQVFVYQGDKSVSETQDVDELAKKMDAFNLQIDNSLENYRWEVVNTSQRNYYNVLCAGDDDNTVCCHYSLTMSMDAIKPEMKHYTYILVAYAGIRSYTGVYNGGIEVCGVIACLNSSISSCGQRFSNYDEIQWPLTFESIAVSAKFVKSENRTQFPNSLLSSIRPIDSSETYWVEKEVEVNGTVFEEKQFATNVDQKRLLTFAILGRNFDLDSPADSDDDDDSNHSSGNLSAAWILLCCSLLILCKIK